MSFPALKKAQLPKAPSLRKLLGPSFILLGLGLGSGELVLWPYLTANYGLGIIWGAVIGITFQFFLNMEISRYTLITGESIFVGFARRWGRALPIWFIVSTLAPWMWPGIVASAATLFAAAVGITYSAIIPIIMLLLIGAILTLGPVIYKTQEKLQKLVIIIGVPFILVLVVLLSKPADVTTLFQGVVGQGNDYFLFPAGLSLATFLGALAYAGAGGNLNLSQSLYVKEKGYGMGAYAGRIVSVVTGKKERLSLTGTTFPMDAQNLARFQTWWRRINTEHALVFWMTGLATMLLLSLLAYVTVYERSDHPSGITFVLSEANAIGSLLYPIFGKLFLITSGTMLFFTQFSVFGSTSRIMSENLSTFSARLFPIQKASLYFYFFLWLQIGLGITVFLLGFTEPLTLVIIGAVMNAFSMFIYTGFVLRLNSKSLPAPVAPSLFRRAMLVGAFLFYGSFSITTILKYLKVL